MLGLDQHKRRQPKPHLFRIQQATRPRRIPSSSSRFRRFQQGVVVRLTASASACKERVQSLQQRKQLTVNFI
jgi:hypothetical protein